MAEHDHYTNFEVYDRSGEQIGKVDNLFVGERFESEYIGLKMSALGTSSTLIPWDLVSRVVDEDGRIEVSVEKGRAKEGPAFDADKEITPEYEHEVRSYYGLGPAEDSDVRPGPGHG
jgi:hypothetical protein